MSRDVYEFLQLDRNATPKELRERAEEKKQRIHNKGMRGPVWDNRKALADICISIFKNEESKRNYDRTLDEASERRESEGRGGRSREFDEAAALLASGWGLVRQGRTDEAVAVARRLTGDDSEYSGFRSTLAELLVTGEKYPDAVDFLYWCEDEEPGNEQYKAMLGRAFAKGGTETWTKHGGKVYATAAEHVAEAKACLSRAREYARALGRRDDGLSREIAMLQEHIRIATQRKWNGNALAVIGGVIVSQILFALPDGSADGMAPVPFDSWGYLMLVSAPVYAASSMDPQWKLNDRWLRGAQVEGCLWYLVKAYLTCMLLPLVAAWKFFTNLLPTLNDRRTDTSKQRAKTEAASSGRDGSALFLIGLVVVVALVVSNLFSVPSEPTGESSRPPGSALGPGNLSNATQPEGDEPSTRGNQPRERPPRDAAQPAVVEETSVDGQETEAAPVGDLPRPAVTANAGDPSTGSTALTSSLAPQASSADRGESLRPGLSASGARPRVPREPVRVGGNVTAPAKVRHVPPVYPPAARQMRAQGVVILEAVIGTTGVVQDVRVLRSVPLLDDAAIAAVRQWRYTPTLLNDVPVPVVMTVTVNFTLQ